MKTLRLTIIGLLSLLFLLSSSSFAQDPLMGDSYKGMRMSPYSANKRFRIPEDAISEKELQLVELGQSRAEVEELAKLIAFLNKRIDSPDLTLLKQLWKSEQNIRQILAYIAGLLRELNELLKTSRNPWGGSRDEFSFFYDHVKSTLEIAMKAPLIIENYLEIGKVTLNKEGIRVFDTKDRCIAFFDIFDDEMKANMLP